MGFKEYHCNWTEDYHNLQIYNVIDSFNDKKPKKFCVGVLRCVPSLQ